MEGIVIATKELIEESLDQTPVSVPRAIVAGLVAVASFLGLAYVVLKAFVAEEMGVMTAVLLLAVLTSMYAWSLYRMFLRATGDRRTAKRRMLIALGVTAALAVVLVVLPALLAGLGFGFGGGSDNDSDGDSDGESGGGSTASDAFSHRSDSSWHLPSLGVEGGDRGSTTTGGEMRRMQETTGGVCPGCGRLMTTGGYLCPACRTIRF
jgi:hypothetical protein